MSIFRVLLLISSLAISISASNVIRVSKCEISTTPIEYPLSDTTSALFKIYSGDLPDVSNPGVYLIEIQFSYPKVVESVEPALFLGPSPYPVIITQNGKLIYRYGNLKNSSTIANFDAVSIPLSNCIKGTNSISIYFYSDGQVIAFPKFEIGNYVDITAMASTQTLFNSHLIQAIAFVALFSFIFFLSYASSNNFKERDTLYFSIFAFTIFLGYSHFIMNGPTHNGLLWFKVSRIAYLFAAYFLFLFSNEFTKRKNIRVWKIILMIIVIPCSLILVESKSIAILNNRFSIISLLYLLPQLGVNLSVLLKGFKNEKSRQMVIIILGYLIFFTTVFYDIGHLIIQKEPYFWTTPYGYFFLISAIIYAITMQRSVLYKDLMTYKSELVLANESLVEAHAEAIEESEAKEQFIRTIAHELRTPLNGMTGTVASFLSDSDINAAVGERCKILHSSFYQFELIIQNILDYQSLRNSNFNLDTRPFNLKSLFDTIMDNCLEEANLKGISLILFFDEKSIPDQLDGDMIQLGVVINNVVRNAVKFTSTGGVSVKVQYLNHSLKVEVSDTGCGIEEDKQIKIFAAFESIEERSFSQKYEGVGLGLAIVDAIISEMGGSISLKSKIHKGTQITLDIPLKESEIVARVVQSGLHILVVDDNRVNRTVAVLQLEKLNCTTSSAENGVEAVEAVKLDEYDAILMDVQMPEMDGLEATNLIKKSNPNLPIIGLTANCSREECIEAGMDDVVFKPISSDILKSVLELVIK